MLTSFNLIFKDLKLFNLYYLHKVGDRNLVIPDIQESASSLLSGLTVFAEHYGRWGRIVQKLLQLVHAAISRSESVV